MQDHVFIPHGPFFATKGLSTPYEGKKRGSSTSPYLIDSIDSIDRVFTGRCRNLNSHVLERRLDFHLFDMGDKEYTFLQMQEDISMIRLSECKYLLALVYGSCISIEKPGELLLQKEFVRFSITLKISFFFSNCKRKYALN